MISTSVIVPVHNGERHLNSLLESLTKQSLSEKWEIVAVDNGSSDGSVAILERYKDRLPLTVIHASERHNPSFARNAGARVARGRFLLFVDADDALAAGYVEHMTRALADHELVTSRVDSTSLNPEWVFLATASRGKPSQSESSSPSSGPPVSTSESIAAITRGSAVLGGVLGVRGHRLLVEGVQGRTAPPPGSRCDLPVSIPRLSDRPVQAGSELGPRQRASLRDLSLRGHARAKLERHAARLEDHWPGVIGLARRGISCPGSCATRLLRRASEGQPALRRALFVTRLVGHRSLRLRAMTVMGQVGKIRIGHLARRTVHHEPASFQQERPIAERCDDVRVVADDDCTVPPRAQLSIAILAALPETRIANRQNFVEHQHLSNRLERDGVGEPR